MERVRLTFKERVHLVAPYAYRNIKEQFVIVVPVCLYIILFQWVVLRYGLAQIGVLTGGIACVFLGLAFFLEGIRIGPVPIGEIVGNALPKKQSSPVVLVFAFFLGLLASFGEPVLGTLQMAGVHLDPERSPLLYLLLVGQPLYLVGTVALGVGVAVVIGTLRFLHGWSLKIIVLPLVTLAIVLTVIAAGNPVLSSAIGLAWDTGAVIVGPVLCPLVLALGVGVCRASGKTKPSLAGFGMVGLISVVPIAAVVLLTFTLYWTGADKNVSAPVPTATTEAASVRPELPSDLDFRAFYPKIRVLQAASPNQAAEFAQVYSVTVADEAHLKGSIRLRPEAPTALLSAVKNQLVQWGWADVPALFWDSLVLGARAIVPIFAFLFLVMILLRQKGPPLAQIFISLAFAIVGLCLFFFGLSIGLGALGNQLGDRIPLAFLDHLPLFPTDTSLYPVDVGKVIVIVFAVILGYGATLAEPAFNVLGQQVEDVTQGAFKKHLFSQAVALGVGIGAGLGIVSLLYDINLLYLLLPPYVLLAILTVVNKEIFVNIAWDGGAVTTGPVTVPLKLALGLSLSSATGAGEGFGVLALASAYPVLNILVLGLILTRKNAEQE